MSRWNPIETFEPGADEARESLADSVSVGKKLYDDAYNSGAGLANVGRDAVKAGAKFNDSAIESVSAFNPFAGTAMRVGQVFGVSALNSAVLSPIDGASQLLSAGANKLTGSELPALNLHVKPDTEGLGAAGKIATIAGTASGYMAPMLLTGRATSALARLGTSGKLAESAGAAGEVAAATNRAATAEHAFGLSSTMHKFLQSPHKSTIDGSIAGFVFTPGQDGGLDVGNRLKAAAINGTAFGTMTATSRKVHQAGESVAGDAVNGAGIVSTTESVGEHTASGVLGGIAAEETKSIAEGRGLASARQLYDAASQMLIRDASATSADKARLSVVQAVK